MKLSKNQQAVVDLMNAGWSLGMTSGLNPEPWIQKGGLGYGGQSKIVNRATFWALWKKHVIMYKGGLQRYPTTEYVLMNHE